MYRKLCTVWKLIQQRLDILAKVLYNKHMTKTNELIQWVGTANILAMYVVMSYFPTLHPWNILFGLVGGLCFFTWTIRVGNRPQMLINAVAIVVCAGGLLKHFG
jgi:hypothetical protein